MKLRLASVGWLLLVCLPALSQDSKQVEKELNREYKGKVVSLRNAYSGSRLRYDAAGDLWDGGPVAPWTLTGRVKVRKISVKKDRLEIQADRLLILYDDKKRGFYHHRSWQKLKIEISSGARQMGVADWKKALERVFVQSEEEWQAALPAPWPAFFEARRQDPSAARLTQAGEENQSNDRPHRVGGSVSPPKCISCPQPEYNEVPRKNRIEGVVVLWAVIDADGRVDNIRIAKPLGAGLDEAALETIQRWRLEPARRDGKPVPAQFTIEVDFHLF